MNQKVEIQKVNFCIHQLISFLWILLSLTFVYYLYFFFIVEPSSAVDCIWLVVKHCHLVAEVWSTSGVAHRSWYPLVCVPVCMRTHIWTHTVLYHRASSPPSVVLESISWSVDQQLPWTQEVQNGQLLLFLFASVLSFGANFHEHTVSWFQVTLTQCFPAHSKKGRGLFLGFTSRRLTDPGSATVPKISGYLFIWIPFQLGYRN